jgi:beta-glucosidase-like glycosyl hydrolase/CubicO group peptidase (beta-lactamase class C family)
MHNRFFRYLVTWTSLIVLFHFNAISSPGIANAKTKEAQQWVDSVMNTLTLREKIAQLFMVAAYSNRDQEHIDEITNLIDNEKIGGLCFFQGGPVRQAALTNYYQSIANVPLLISIDAEWGLGMRLDSTFTYPRQMMLGAMDDNRLIYHMGADIAQQLKRIGVHINFAPVVDINSNPRNPVINTRAFGENKEMVTQKGLAYMLGLQDNGILACAKHFPGHGDTDTDSHYDLPLMSHSAEHIDSIDLYPFKKLIESGISSVMVAHIEIPSLEKKSKLASSLSYSIVTSLLINDLAFNGLIFTDALNMNGVSDYYKPVDLNYLALKAGNDVLLYPSEVKASINKIEKEVKRGRFPEEEINRRCRKIIEAKYKVGLYNYQPIILKNLVEDLNKPGSEILVRQITEQAITVLNNHNDIVPIRKLDTLRIAYLEIGDNRGTVFKQQMELYAPIENFAINGNTSDEELNIINNQLDKFNLVVIGYHSLVSNPKLEFGTTPQISYFIDGLISKKNVILTLFGTPYALGKFKNINNAKGLIIAYDNSSYTQSLTAQLLFGGIEVIGRLPVSINSQFVIGAGTDAGSRIRLAYSIPEELNISSVHLSKIDSIALDAIAQEAAPGMQILAAKSGIVFYNKCFGHYTYNDTDLPVNIFSLYDVASLTKIASTLLLTMDMQSKGTLLLDSKLRNYITLPDTSKYNDLIISDILLHQAGLVAWIPFYQRTLQPLYPKQTLRNSKFSNTYPYQLGANSFLNKNAYPQRKFYRSTYSDQFPNEVASGLYSTVGIKDSVINWIIRTPLSKQGTYLYSDLGFILMQGVISNLCQISHQEYLIKNFYSGLGMNNTLFNPLKRFNEERIVPTENDLLFRKQLLWGHVHDPAAAMMGGIAGHAGLFSTSNDLAKLLQMYLNKGEYGGDMYLPASTIEMFTSCVNCKNGVRRGLGFDKPEPDPKKINPVSKKATSLSYGHSGFTGVLVWVDPAYELIYIFLSNRIHPDADNRKLIEMDVRTKIQDVLYDAILEAEKQ